MSFCLNLAFYEYAVRLMGHPVTPSTGAVDYFLSLDVELEDGQNDYMEQMVRVNLINTAHLQQACRAKKDAVIFPSPTEKNYVRSHLTFVTQRPPVTAEAKLVVSVRATIYLRFIPLSYFSRCLPRRQD